MIVNNVNSPAAYYSNSVAAARYTNAAGYVRGVQKSGAFTPSREAQNFMDMFNKLKQEKISSGQYSVSAENIALSLLTNRY